MPALHAEPLIFALAWAALAIGAGMSAGWQAGAMLSVGLLVILLPASSLVLARTDNEALERSVRWGLLLAAAAAFALYSSSSS